MTMTVARYRRTWTPELTSKLLREVNQLTAAGKSHTEAYRILSSEWGVAPNTLSVRVWHSLQTSKTKKVAPKSSLKSNVSGDIENAIATLKKLGVKVTLTF